MTVTVLIPASFRRIAEDLAAVEVEAHTVRDALKALEAAHPGVLARVCDDGGNPRRSVEIYKDLEDIRFLDNLDTALEQGSEVKIIAGPSSFRGAA